MFCGRVWEKMNKITGNEKTPAISIVLGYNRRFLNLKSR